MVARTVTLAGASATIGETCRARRWSFSSAVTCVTEVRRPRPRTASAVRMYRLSAARYKPVAGHANPAHQLSSGPMPAESGGATRSRPLLCTVQDAHDENDITANRVHHNVRQGCKD